MPTKQAAAQPKRIPVGSRVRWFARYPSDPIHEGVVQAFVPRGSRWPASTHCMGKNLGGDAYLALRDRTPSGQPKATPDIMRPYASRLEAQNPELLQVTQ